MSALIAALRATVIRKICAALIAARLTTDARVGVCTLPVVAQNLEGNSSAVANLVFLRVLSGTP